MGRSVILYRSSIALLLIVLFGTMFYYESLQEPQVTKTVLLNPVKEKEQPAVVVAESEQQQSTETTIDIDTEETSYDSQGFKKTFVRKREHIVIRSDNYGIGNSKKILIQWHPGGQRCDVDDMKETIAAVVQRMPNLKSTPEFKALLLETMITETDLGGEKWETGISKWKNYGIAQFRMDTAKSTLEWLEEIRPDVYKQVMSFYDKKKDLAYNITYNIPFSIALMAQYYWRIVPDVYLNIGTLEKRAEMWKAAYNTYKGKGTVNSYIKRVNRFTKETTKPIEVAQKKG